MKLLKMSNFAFFLECFLCNLYLEILYGHIQLASAASLNLGWFQNGVLGNGLTKGHIFFTEYSEYECSSTSTLIGETISIAECNTILSAYKLYRHLE